MPQQNQQDKKQISRRDVIKAAGVLSLGLLYTKPFVEKIHAQPAFQGYGPVDNNPGELPDCDPDVGCE
jgi:hypothetical protein